MSRTSLALLEMIGLRAVVLPDLAQDATIVRSVNVVLIDLSALASDEEGLINGVLAAAVNSEL